MSDKMLDPFAAEFNKRYVMCIDGTGAISTGLCDSTITEPDIGIDCVILRFY